MDSAQAGGRPPGTVLRRTLDGVRGLDPAATAAAEELHTRLTKPAGSLGALEELSVRLAGLAGQCPPPLPQPAALAVFAGDHGVHAQGVTGWPQEVTGQMVANMLGGGAVVNAFARQNQVSVVVVDVGVAQPLPGAGPAGADPLPDGLPEPGAALLWPAKVRPGTADMTAGPALTAAEAVAALEVGIAVADRLVDAGAGALLTGEMGIANTTPAAALIAAFTGADPAQATGRGTGVDEQTFAHKVDVVRAALARHAGAVAALRAPAGDGGDPGAVEKLPAVRVLAAVGGLEHAALAGLILGGAARRVPVILDGVIAVSAALAAAALAPAATCAMVAGHRSAEPGATLALTRLGLTPLVDLGLRLGEGSGAVLATSTVAAAARVLREVATFDSAGVSEK